MWPRSAHASGRVAFIKADVLSQFGILYKQSNELVQQVGARCWHPDDRTDVVQYCHSDHWMIYGWIPPQAICATTSLHEYTQACYDLREQRGTLKNSFIQNFLRDKVLTFSLGQVFYVSPEDVLEQIKLSGITDAVDRL